MSVETSGTMPTKYPSFGLFAKSVKRLAFIRITGAAQSLVKLVLPNLSFISDFSEKWTMSSNYDTFTFTAPRERFDIASLQNESVGNVLNYIRNQTQWKVQSGGTYKPFSMWDDFADFMYEQRNKFDTYASAYTIQKIQHTAQRLFDIAAEKGIWFFNFNYALRSALAAEGKTSAEIDTIFNHVYWQASNEAPLYSSYEEAFNYGLTRTAIASAIYSLSHDESVLDFSRSGVITYGGGNKMSDFVAWVISLMATMKNANGADFMSQPATKYMTSDGYRKTFTLPLTLSASNSNGTMNFIFEHEL